MRLIQKEDFNTCLNILSNAFMSNPSVNWVVKNDRKRPARIRQLAHYSLKTAYMRKGAFISDQGHGIALCYPINYKKEGIADYRNQAILLFKAIGIGRLTTVLKREAYVKAQRPFGNYLYFWFFGVQPGQHNSGDAREIRDEIFQWADQLQLPICLETSVAKNRRVYERYGFKVYHHWKVQEQGIDLYFMKRTPNATSGD